MKKRKANNRNNGKNRTLRSGRNKSRLSNQITLEKVIGCIDSFLAENKSQILNVARDFYDAGGRGCVNIALTDHPDIPYETDKVYYVSEDEYKDFQSHLMFDSEGRVAMSELLLTYKPDMQAVVCVWYDTVYYIVKLTSFYAFTEAMRQASRIVH